ncbi:hypothetical protein I4F81_011615 [Pyropia yezoensis]|uniref:Uncharacterized protein n=1 Tax=Pyropia yezoensis TaxID=2788 RepID=A0ACC3CH45_PYRYE|nr:hypothetical protein I4F81_011615 [Neopyropia yezoensis]
MATLPGAAPPPTRQLAAAFVSPVPLGRPRPALADRAARRRAAQTGGTPRGRWGSGGGDGGGPPLTPEQEEDVAVAAAATAERSRAAAAAAEEAAEEARRRRRDRVRILAATALAWADEPCTGRSANAARARAYVATERRLSAATVAAFGIGSAPDACDFLTTSLTRDCGYEENECVAVGLLSRSAKMGRVYDMFRDRVMVPIRMGTGMCDELQECLVGLTTTSVRVIG